MCQQMKRATRSLVKPCGGDPGADVIFEGSSNAEAGPSGIPQKLENACAYRHFRVDQEETFGGFATSLMKRLRKRVKQANMSRPERMPSLGYYGGCLVVAFIASCGPAIASNRHARAAIAMRREP